MKTVKHKQIFFQNLNFKYEIFKMPLEGVTSGSGTAYPSGTPPVFSGVRFIRSLVLFYFYIQVY